MKVLLAADKGKQPWLASIVQGGSVTAAERFGAAEAMFLTSGVTSLAPL